MKLDTVILHFALLAANASANTAVSETNGKLDSAYGKLDSSEAWINSGSFSNPIAESLGLQIDGLFADVADTDYSGLGTHLFWRDFNKGLLGITAGGVWSNDADSYELGLEAESYRYNWVTLGVRAGYADLDSSIPTFLSSPDDSGIYALTYATFYPHEDLALTIGCEHRFNNIGLHLGLEYDLPIVGLTTFAEAVFAEQNRDHVMFGLRYYFGSEKPLQERHRRDDPPNILHTIMQSMQFQPNIPAPPA